MITVISWKWNQPNADRQFRPEYVNIHRAMVARWLKQPHRYVCCASDPDGVETEIYPLWTDHSSIPNHNGRARPTCYRRLKLFDPETTRALGIEDGDRVVSMDLDVVVVGELDPLFDRPEPFVGWAVPGGRHARVFNGTVWMLRAGMLPSVWTEFDPRTSPTEALKHGYFGTDQGWLSYQLAQVSPGWSREDGVLGYARDCRLTGGYPTHARLVSFHGSDYKPWDHRTQQRSPWILNHWRM